MPNTFPDFFIVVVSYRVFCLPTNLGNLLIFIVHFCSISVTFPCHKKTSNLMMPLLEHLVWTLCKTGVIKSLPRFQINSFLSMVGKVRFPWLLFLSSPGNFSLLYRPVATGERYQCSLQTGGCGHCPGNCEIGN